MGSQLPERGTPICIAIYQGPGTTLPDDAIYHSWLDNPDGGGLMFIDDEGRIQVHKSEDLSEFCDLYSKFHGEFGDRSPFVIHLRFATHGLTDLTNVHPFPVPNGGVGETYVAHNGVIDVEMGKKEVRSDTRVFVDEYLSALPRDWVDTPSLVHMVEDFIDWSKLVILTTDPVLRSNVYIINEASGHWDKGGQEIWYSNNSYEPSWYRTVTKAGTTKLVQWDKWGDDLAPAVKRGGLWDEEEADADDPREPAKVTADGKALEFATFRDYLDHMYPDEMVVCHLCGEHASSTGLCPLCEWCSLCDNGVELCACVGDDGKSIHDMSDEEVARL